MIEQFYLIHRWDPTTNPGQSASGSNGIEVKKFGVLLHCHWSTLMVHTGLHHLMQFSFIPRTLVRAGRLLLCRDAVNVFSSFNWQGDYHIGVVPDDLIIHHASGKGFQHLELLSNGPHQLACSSQTQFYFTLLKVFFFLFLFFLFREEIICTMLFLSCSLSLPSSYYYCCCCYDLFTFCLHSCYWQQDKAH